MIKQTLLVIDDVLVHKIQLTNNRQLLPSSCKLTGFNFRIRFTNLDTLIEQSPCYELL